MSQSSKYRFSFTAASLMHVEMVKYAEYLVDADFDFKGLSPDLLNKDKAKTGKREFAEIKPRLESLTNEEIQLLAAGDATTQKLLCYITCCRVYAYFRDFVRDVVLENVSLFNYQISDMDYNVFFNKKCIDHEELEALTDLTKSKIRQVIFKILEQAGIIDNVKTRKIIVPIIDTRLENTIKNSNPRDLALLLMPQYA